MTFLTTRGTRGLTALLLSSFFMVACQPADKGQDGNAAAASGHAAGTEGSHAEASAADDVAIVNVGDLQVSEAWTRATPTGARVGGGFLQVRNAGTGDDRLIAASSPDAARVEIHTMTMDGGVMRMRQLTEGLAVPAHTTVALAPGGVHLMLMEITHPFVAGQHVVVTLQFEQAGDVELRLPVQPLGATSMDAQPDAAMH